MIQGLVNCGLSGVLLMAGWSGTLCPAQDGDVNLALHANSHATADKVGLPLYPGAKLAKEKDDKDNDSADLGFSFGDFQFRVVAVSYTTPDSPEQVLAFYRRPLSRFGQVLECDHGQPVGKLTMTSTGLTCSDKHSGHVQVNGAGNSTDQHELRAGSPHKYRIVEIEQPRAANTRFGLVYLELPKDKKNPE